MAGAQDARAADVAYHGGANRGFQIDLGELADEFSDCSENTDCSTGECRVKVLPTLYRILRVIADSEDRGRALSIILEVMEQRMRMVRGMVSLLDRKSDTIFIHESFGLTEAQKARGLYVPGEGIIGQVVASAKAIVAPRLRDNPVFLNRTGSRGDGEALDCAFLCVPILNGGKVLGTISGERVYANARLLKQDFELMATIASMIAPAVELYLLENIERKNLESENRRLHAALKERFKPDNIIGSSKPMRDVYELIGKIAPAKTSVLILGESGVGKELVANAIHSNSAVSGGPFIKFNCAALPETIVESELFGHEKGSFTGATGLRKGRFELADGGTIFLDEVGELPLSIQAKLLRVLQDKTFERIGGTRPVTVDLRIIAATNRDLTQMIADGRFREDLYYRLNVFPITIPPLRQRGSDVIALADHFVARFTRDTGKPVTRISTPALNMLGGRLRIAMATRDAKAVNEPFGQAQWFSIYDLTAGEIELVGVVEFTPVPRKCAAANDNPDDCERRIEARMDALSGCHVIFARQLGDAAAASAMKRQMHPVEVGGDPSIAALLGRCQAMLATNPPRWLRRLTGTATDSAAAAGDPPAPLQGERNFPDEERANWS
ncbi:MAG: sigma 54-interacting transcriptional regulator [Rhodospirillales bacterium]